MRECESKADNDSDPVLKVWVEGWYRQWNRMTFDTKQPIWVIRAEQIVVLDESGSRSDLKATPELLLAISSTIRND